MDGFVGGHLATVPEVDLALIQALRVRRHQNLVSRLTLSALLALEHPAQTRMPNVHADRVDAIFAAKITGRDRRRSGLGDHHRNHESQSDRERIHDRDHDLLRTNRQATSTSA
jgi:hypothetical protein